MALVRKKKPTKALAKRKAQSGKAKSEAKSKAKSSETKPTARKSGKSASTLARITKRDPLDGLIDAARAFGLDIKAEWEPAVRANLQVILGQAALFTDFELPEDAEPAPIFKA